MGNRRALFCLFVVLLVALPATVAYGDPGETKVLDLRTKSQPGSRTIVFCRAEGPVDHAVVVLGRMAPGAQAPEIFALGLVPRTDPLGVPTAYVGPVEKELVEKLLKGELPLPTHRLVCQVDSEVFRAAMVVHEQWRAKSDHGLTTVDCVAFINEIATAAGLKVMDRKETAPGRVISALLADNDPDAVPETPAPADPPVPADPAVPAVPEVPAVPADPARLPAGRTLPRVGTLGAVPPAAETIVVDVTGDGRLLVDGEDTLTLVALSEALQRRTAGPNWRELDRSSRKHLLVRADASVPWRIAQWILMMAADPRVGIYKIHFGATSRGGEGDGAIGCELPKDRGITATEMFAEERPVVRTRIFMSTRPESDPEALFLVLARLRATSGEGVRFEIATPPPKGRRVPAGFVIRVMDVALRAGFQSLVLEGAPMPEARFLASADFLRSVITEQGEAVNTPTIHVGNAIVGRLPGGDAVPPARGLLPTLYGFAGRTGDADEPLSEDHVETDGDLPFEESLGEDGISDAPFTGPSGAYERTPDRHDYSLEPPDGLLLPRLQGRGVSVRAIGKIRDLYAGVGIDESFTAKSNAEGMARLDALHGDAAAGPELILLNLVDFDMLWGHRNDPAGMRDGLVAFDAWLAGFLERQRPGELLLLTADHGNDPTTPSTDHSREHVPLLAHLAGGGPGRDLGLRLGFMDVAATLAAYFGHEDITVGRSFLPDLQAGGSP